MGKTANERNAADRYRRALHGSTALGVILCISIAGQQAFGQTVTATGDVNPGGSGPRPPIWNLPGTSLTVGSIGNGTLTISDGGEVSNAQGRIGYSADSSGTVTVSGPGSKWTNTGSLDVGLFGTGTLTISDGGEVSNTFGYIGNGSRAGPGGEWLLSDGTVTVSGAGSKWTNTGNLDVGVFGTGTLTISDGGEVSSLVTSIGSNSNSTGTLNLFGTAPGGRGVLETAYVVKGAGGAATLNLNGGILRATRDESDFLRNFGVLTVGTNGAWFDTNGYSVIIDSDTTFSGSGAFNKIGLGTLTLTGDSSTHTGNTIVDGGTLAIAAGGKLGGSWGYIGNASDSNGAAEISGPGSNWTNAYNLSIGVYSKGTLSITDGGTVSNGSGHIGLHSSSAGSSVTVSGNASTWTNSGELNVGSSTLGTLVIEDGGKVSNFSGWIGRFGSSAGSSVTVSGDGSTWTNSGNLFVGANHMATLIIKDGATVSSATGYISYGSPASGSSVTVSGNASIWSISGNLDIGVFSSGTLTIEDGGVVSSGENADGLGTVRLGIETPGTGTLNIGTATGIADSEAGTLKAATVEFHNGNGTINFNHTGDTVFSAAFVRTGSGTHAVNHLAGFTTLTGASSGFTGTTTVFGGTLLVGDAAGNGTLGGIVHVGLDGTLGGSGTLTGAVTIDGTLAAGNSPGMLTFTNGLTLNAGSTSVFELNTPGMVGGTGAGGNDLVTVNGGALTLGGTLEAHVAAAGYYRLFEYSGALSGTFAGGTVTGTVGFVASDPNNPDIRYDTPGQVNLSVLGAGQTMQFWDGTNPTGGVDGGNGTWQSFATNWTDDTGSANAGWGGSVGVFAGTAGTVTVQGTQSFDTLQFSTDGYVVTGDGLSIGVAGGGTLNIDNGVTATVASVIEGGAGSLLRKAGGGTLVLTGTNTYAGGTHLLGGVVSVASDANLGAAAGGLTFDGGALQVTGTAYAGTTRGILIDAGGGGFDIADVANIFTLAQDITGTGDLLKRGDGTLVLTGANAYGDTLVAGGTLVGDTGSISGNIGNAATLVFDQAANAGFAGDIVGLNGTDGSMVKRGAGVLTLAGSSALDWTIEAGELLTEASRFGGGADIAGTAALTFTPSSAALYAGILSGAGGFNVDGAGAVTLTGDSAAFTGTTSVSNGSLVVGTSAGGALGGSVLIGSGGMLGGTGTVGSVGSKVTIATGGVHAPGNSIGVQNVAGDYINHGTLRIEATPVDADRIVVAGSVDITGATLDLVLSPTDAASWNVFNGPYTIIDKSSAGGVVGTFAQPYTQNLLFLDALIAYDGGDGNDVTLELVRNDLAFAQVGSTRNQIATGTAIDTLGNANPIWRSIALTNNPDIVRASFDALSGEIYASARTALFEDSRFLRNAVNDRIRAAFGDTGASVTPILTYGLGDNPVLVAADHAGAALWLNGFGSWGSTDSDGNAAHLDRSTGGLLIGTDGMMGDWRIGLLAGYSRSSFKASDRASSGSSDNYHLGLYGGTQWGDLALRSGAAYTWHDIDTARRVTIPGITESLSAGYNAGTFQAFGELGYGIDMGNGTRLEAFANLAHVSLRSDGFTETGVNTALTGSNGNIDVTFTTYGLHGEHVVTFGTVDAAFKGMLGWRHAFGDTTPTSTHAFSAGDAFSIAGAPIARNSAVIEAGLDLNLTPDASFSLSYTGQVATEAQDHGFRANFNVRF